MIQRIWTNRNGDQKGPFTMEELQSQGPLTRDTYVWFKGMDDWKKATEVPELADLVEQVVTPEIPEDMPPVPQFATQPLPEAGQPLPPQYVQQAPVVPPKCPPHNIFWSAVALIFCCSIPAIVAIVYGAQVRSKYNMGDYEKAQKYSDRSAWWCIGAIVLGILSLPLSLALTLLQ